MTRTKVYFATTQYGVLVLSLLNYYAEESVLTTVYITKDAFTDIILPQENMRLRT